MTYVGFEKIKQQPIDDDAILRSLISLAEITDHQAQAEGIAQLALSIASAQPLRAFECLEVAFRLNPQSEVVMSCLEKMFDLRGDRSAQLKLQELRSSQHTQGTRIKSIAQDAVVATEDDRGTKIVVRPTETDTRKGFETKVDNSAYGIFRDFVKLTKLNVRFLENAIEFSDDWVGLVQFVNYLASANHLKGESALAVIESLKRELKEKCPNIKAHVRFTELLEHHITKKS